MKTREFVNLEKRLMRDLPGFAIKGSLMLISPVGHTLRGFCFDTSGFNRKAFYVWRLFMPLCIPAKYIHFTFGQRLGDKKRWRVDQPELDKALGAEMVKELPFLLSLKTAKDVAQAVEPLTKGSNPHCHEAYAYTLIQAGEIKSAEEALDTLQKLINPNVTWQQEISSRAQIVQEKLQKNVTEAETQLSAWESETVSNLGLEAFRNGWQEGQKMCRSD